MATKDALSSKHPNQSFVTGAKDHDSQYSNLNLNQNYKCVNVVPVHSHSKSSSNNKSFGKKSCSS